MLSNYFIYIVLIGLMIITKIFCETCSNEKDCTTTIDNKYNKEINDIINNIKIAEENYEPCKQENCSCHSNIITNDLLPFKDTGITREMIDAIKQYGTKYQIIDHKLYRQKECLFPSRCLGIEYFLKKNLKQLPNLEMIINTRDWPQIHKDWHNFKGPVFSFSKTNEYLDIQYPAWSFWEGGPAISLYPKGLGRWDQHRQTLKLAAEKWPWKKKISKGFFRGSRTSNKRDTLILLSRSNLALVDAQYTKNQAWKSSADTLNAEPAKEIPLEEHCKYKYLFNFRGVAASFRFKHLFLCKSLVFHVGNEWQEFFYQSIKPWIHYVPVDENVNSNDLEIIISFFQKHDKLAERIAERGYQHIFDNLNMKDIHCYWRKLLKNYAKLFRYKIVKDTNLIMISENSR